MYQDVGVPVVVHLEAVAFLPLGKLTIKGRQKVRSRKEMD